MAIEESSFVSLAGVELPVSTTPLDAPTMFVDGVKGVVLSQSVVRLGFIEHVLDTNEKPGTPESIKGRHVVNLVLDHHAFLSVMELLERVKADMGRSPND